MSLAHSVNFIYEFVAEATDWEILGGKVRLEMVSEFEIQPEGLKLV